MRVLGVDPGLNTTGYGIVEQGEAGLRIVLSVARVSRVERYFLSTYVTAWLNKEVRIEDFTPCEHPLPTGGSCQPAVWKITMAQSAVVAGVILAVLLAAMLWSVRRRDVT